MYRKSTVPVEGRPAFTAPRPSKTEQRKMQRARKRVSEITKVNEDLKKPTRTELKNKKDQKDLNRQVEVSREAVELKKRNSVSRQC